MNGFKKVKGFDGYYINDCGDVIGTRGWKLKPSPDKDGYLKVNLYYEKGKYKTKRIHKLVAENFIGPIPDGYEVNHINGDITDNRACNLEIVTKKYNLMHQINTLKSNSKINYEIAKKIRLMYADGNITISKIAEKYNISDSQVQRIIKNKRWKKEFHEREA